MKKRPDNTVSKNPNKNWKNNAIQFPRLIAELEAVGAFTHSIMADLSGEMDLSKEEIAEIVDRAQAEWDKIKLRTLPPNIKHLPLT